MRNKLFTGSVFAGSLALGVFTHSYATAASLTVNLTKFTGDNAGGEITLTDSGPDKIDFLVKITPPTVNGDIRGIYFNLLGGTLGLIATGSEVTGTYFNKCSGGGGNNLNGGGSPCPFNVVLDIGQAGSDIITQTSFTVARSGLSVESFFGQSFGLRYQQTGEDKKGSSKLKGVAPETAIPTLALLPGLIGMGLAAWRKRKSEQAESEA